MALPTIIFSKEEGVRLFNFDFPFNFRHFNSPSPPNSCSCLIYQAQLPNKLGNYIFKQPQGAAIETL